MIGLVPEGLDKYLNEYSKDPKKQIQIVPTVPTETPSSSRNVDRHVYIVEPGKEEKFGHSVDSRRNSSAASKQLFENLPKYLEIVPNLLENNYDAGSSRNFCSANSDSSSKVFLIKSDGEVVNVAGQQQQGTSSASAGSAWPGGHSLTRFCSERIIRSSFRRWAKRRRSLQPVKQSKLLTDSLSHPKRGGRKRRTKSGKNTEASSSKGSEGGLQKTKLSSSLTDILTVISDPVTVKKSRRRGIV